MESDSTPSRPHLREVRLGDQPERDHGDQSSSPPRLPDLVLVLIQSNLDSICARFRADGFPDHADLVWDMSNRINVFINERTKGDAPQ
jgi:hypothetical protein